MRDILVHLGGDDHDVSRLDIAIGIAKQHGALLTGLFARVDSHRPGIIARRASEALINKRDCAKEMFLSAVSDCGVAFRWWQLSHGEVGHVINETTFCARHVDLVVMGQFDSKVRVIPEELVEHVILHCGRPALVIPQFGTFSTIGERIVVAWNADREAVRALNDAKPFLGRAKSVTILSLLDPSGAPFDVNNQGPEMDIVGHLSRWGIEARFERMPVEGVDKMDMLLSRLCDLEADMLVMGAHSHSSLAPRHGIGAAYVLRHMTVPTLLAG